MHFEHLQYLLALLAIPGLIILYNYLIRWKKKTASRIGDPLLVKQGQRYRITMENKSGDDHPVHFHRHTFELTRIGEKTTAGILKDTVNVPRRQIIEIDFVADDPGLTLYHCHMQLHMDFGFMGLMKYG